MEGMYTYSSDKNRFLDDLKRVARCARGGIDLSGVLSEGVLRGVLEYPSNGAREFWVLTHQGEAVASIGAMASVSEPAHGYVGLMEYDAKHPCGREAISTLVVHAKRFLKEQGCSTVYGPMLYNTWLPYRYRLPESSPHCFSWEPDTPDGYMDILKASGFVLDEAYHSTAFGDLDRYLASTQTAYENAIHQGYTFQRIDGASALQQHIPLLHQLSHTAFAENFMFEPIPLPLFINLYVQLARKKHKQHLYIVNAPSGQPLGFVFSFEDAPESAAGIASEAGLIIKTLAVIPEGRGRGLSNALTYLIVEDAVQNGISYAVAAMVRAGIQSESYAKKGGFLWQNRYGLFRAQL